MKKRRQKKGLAILLAVVMVLGMIPEVGALNVSAEENTEAHEHLYDNGVCTVCSKYEVPYYVDTYYQIANMGNLYWFAGLVNGDAEIIGDVEKNTSANAVLTADITVNTGVLDNNGELVSEGNNFRPWIPIDSDVDNGYTGTFDGKGYTVSGLYFNNPKTSHVGFFGCVGEGGSISNLGIVESYFSGSQSVGAVCGWSKGNITNCYNTGTVKGASNHTGGICGYLDFPSYTISITNCYNTGKVSGSNYVGGVCGYSHGNITNCYNTGTVEGISVNNDPSDNTGGICGKLLCLNTPISITNCYNTGKVSGANSVGGVCGLRGEYSNSNIKNCYNAAEVSGESNVGGVCGLISNEKSTITNCYYEKMDGISGGINGNDVKGQAEGKTKDQFSGGEVVCLLQGEQEEAVWGQILSGTGKQGYPVLGGIPVYHKEEGYTNIYGSLTEGTSTITASNGSLMWYEFTPGASGTYLFVAPDNQVYVREDISSTATGSPYYTKELVGGKKYCVCIYGGTAQQADLTIKKFETSDMQLKVGKNSVYITEPDTWYEFTPEANGNYRFSSINIHGGICVNTEKKTSNGMQGISSSPVYSLSAKTTYYVYLNCSPGEYDLTIEKLDTTLNLGKNKLTVSTTGKLWYEFTPNETGTYQFSNANIEGGYLYVVTDKNDTSSTYIPYYPTYNLNAETTYYVAISCSPGEYDLTIKKLDTILEVGENEFEVSASLTWYEFIPNETGTYKFSSTKLTDGNLYVNTTKSESDYKEIGSSPIYELNAGTTYTVAISALPGSYDLNIERIQYKVTLTSAVAGGSEPESVVTLTGGGVYDALKEVTVSAPEKEGFTFAGWYIAGYENPEETEPVCSTLEYTFVPDADISLVAVYKANANIELNVSGDSNSYSVNGTTQSSNSYTESFKAGTSITVKYTGSNTFCYWKNDSGKIVSRSPEYTFALVSKTTLTAVAVGTGTGSEQTGYSALIEFVSYYGQIMQASTWSSKDTASDKTLPVAPSKLGGTFKYWSIDGENEATAETIISAIDGSATRITVQPVYEESTTTYTVTIKYPAEFGKEDKVYNSQKLGDTLTVTADAVEGQLFAYWAADVEGKEKLSYNESYFIMISGNVILYPIYFNEEVEAEPVISVTKVYSSIVDGKNKVSFEITRSVPDSYEVVETGVLGIIDGTYNESSDMTITSSTARKAVSSSTSNNGIYTMNINVTDKLDTTLAVRGYMIVKNKATGNTSVIYTDVNTTTFNTIQGGNTDEV